MKLGFINQVGLVSVCVKFQLSSWSRSGIKVPGGVVGWGGFRLCISASKKKISIGTKMPRLNW